MNNFYYAQAQKFIANRYAVDWDKGVYVMNNYLC